MAASPLLISLNSVEQKIITLFINSGQLRKIADAMDKRRPTIGIGESCVAAKLFSSDNYQIHLSDSDVNKE